MLAPRVIIGPQNNGNLGLRVSAIGVDASQGDGQGGDFTFNSDWTDISKIHMVGIGSYGPIEPDSIGNPQFGIRVYWTDLGYKPFMEVRRLQGTVVYDDWFSSSCPSGCYAAIDGANTFRLYFSAPTAGTTVLYAIYRIPVPSG